MFDHGKTLFCNNQRNDEYSSETLNYNFASLIWKIINFFRNAFVTGKYAETAHLCRFTQLSYTHFLALAPQQKPEREIIKTLLDFQEFKFISSSFSPNKEQLFPSIEFYYNCNSSLFPAQKAKKQRKIKSLNKCCKIVSW